MFQFLKRRSVMVAIGILFLALLVWFVGPYLTLGLGEAEAQPLLSVWARLVVIGVVVAAALLIALVKRLRTQRAGDKLMAEVAQPSETDGRKGEPRPPADAAQLQERFESAVARLKERRRGEHGLYELPWYVIIGAPGSGKTTVLLNSGLKFPAEQRSGRGAVRGVGGVGGTRNCDWWFTDEAVFLDTAGRYTTQDSDAGNDAAGWIEFLGLLKKYRGRRPLNGILVAVSAQDVLMQGNAAREAHADAVRRRLDEITRELKIQLPVYLMVTKFDMVAGFTEYFDDLTPEERGQVWGATVPYEATAEGGAAARVPDELRALVERLNQQLFDRLHDEHDPKRRAKILAFPSQVAALAEPLSDFIGEVFGATRFDRRLLLRGVYLTSGTQEGTPIDRLMGALVRRFAVTPDAVAAPARGKAYFIDKALRAVIFAESGLAGVNRRLEARMAAWQLALYGGLLAVAVLGVLALTVSYLRNRAYLNDVSASLERLAETSPQPPEASIEAALPRLDAVRAVYLAANAPRAGNTLLMRWGLFQPGSVGDAARDAYVRELDGALLPRVADHIETQLRGGNLSPEQLYQYLKAYLMLGLPDRLEPDQLGFIADQAWSEVTDGEQAAALSEHFGSLLEQEAKLRPITPDATLVAQARATIRQVSPERLVYSELRLRFASDDSELRLDERAGIGVERVLRRKSGRPLSQPIPAIYTTDVFKRVTSGRVEQVAAEYATEQWVWGDEGAPRTRPTDLVVRVIDLYEDDYIRYWDGVLKDIEIVPLGSLARTKDALDYLARPTSPLRGLLRAIDEQTFLVGEPDKTTPRSVSDRAKAIFQGGVQRAGELMGTRRGVPGAKVTAHFADLHRLVTANQGGGAPLDDIIRRLGELQQKVSVLGDEAGKVRPTDTAANAAAGAAAESLRRDAEGLPPGPDAVVKAIATGTAGVLRGALRGNVSQLYEEEVLRECRQMTTRRYPFDLSSSSDLPVEDFGRLFGYGGVFDEFFKTSLSDLVDTSRRPWVWRRDESGNPLGGGISLERFQEAEVIREAFFRRGGAEPDVTFQLSALRLNSDAGPMVVEIDGQSLRYAFESERPVSMKWPGPSPGKAQVLFKGTPVVTAQGPWALFRLLDGARVSAPGDFDYRIVFADREGRDGELRLVPSRTANPFARKLLQQFRCG